MSLPPSHCLVSLSHSSRSGQQPLQLLLRVRSKSQGELASRLDDGPAHPRAVFRQPGDQLLCGKALRFRPALGSDELLRAASLLRQSAQLGGGERLLDQIAFLDGQLLSREKLPRLHAAGSAGFAIETDHGRECTSVRWGLAVRLLVRVSCCSPLTDASGHGEGTG